MAKPYGILSDLHLHSWSAFATTLPSGMNSRLQIILDEIWRAATELDKAGGEFMYLAGDIFHVRGSVTPDVLNPVLDLFERIKSELGIKVRAIPGNHDLASKESAALTNAAQALEKVGVTMIAEQEGAFFSDTNTIVVPWHASPSVLMVRLKELAATASWRSQSDLIIHAPVNGVIMGIPDHGLNAADLAALDFRRVFAGHYHNHVEFPGGVYSIGATTHQTWSDVGTKAGFLLVYPDRVEYRASHAPEFIDITAATDPTQLPMIVDGNYVRVKLDIEKESEIEAARASLIGLGAKGVIIHHTKKAPEVVRAVGGVRVSTLEAAIGDYVKAAFGGSKELGELCQEIILEAAAV